MPLVGIGDLSTVANTIQQVEGYYPGTIAYANNNPGNLRCCSAGVPCANQSSSGATGCDSNNFAVFPSYDDGYSALENQITLDASRGLSIADFTSKYAPAQDSNDPASYAATIASATGLSVSDPLSAALTTGTDTDDDTGGGISDLGLSLPSFEYNSSLVVLGAIAVGLLLFAVWA
jgi:hypothetical protein